MHKFHQLSATSLQGQPINFSDFEGKVVLIVNTASKCGFTYQYESLQALHNKYASQGLVILGFPCNQFGGQEAGDDSEIKDFCDLQFNITFPLFSKIEVNGDGTHPLYKILKEEAPGLLGSKKVKWNFTKFLCDRKGIPYKRYSPTRNPSAMENDIVTLLDAEVD